MFKKICFAVILVVLLGCQTIFGAQPPQVTIVPLDKGVADAPFMWTSRTEQRFIDWICYNHNIRFQRSIDMEEDGYYKDYYTKLGSTLRPYVLVDCFPLMIIEMSPALENISGFGIFCFDAIKKTITWAKVRDFESDYTMGWYRAWHYLTDQYVIPTQSMYVHNYGLEEIEFDMYGSLQPFITKEALLYEKYYDLGDLEGYEMKYNPFWSALFFTNDTTTIVYTIPYFINLFYEPEDPDALQRKMVRIKVDKPYYECSPAISVLLYGFWAWW